jgi:hypothetical protein
VWVQLRSRSALSVVAKPKIVAQNNVRNRQALNKNSIDKLLCRHGLQSLSKPYPQNSIYTQRLQREKLFPKATNSRGRIKRREILSGKRLEHDNNRGQSQLLGLAQQLPNDLAMPQMNAIKGTNGRHAPSVSGPQIVKASYQLHE